MKSKRLFKEKAPQTPTIPPKAQAVVDAYRDPERLKTDPNGSYTGVPLDKSEQPVQDVDDL